MYDLDLEKIEILDSVECKTFGEALHILGFLREMGLQASYHPSGGTNDVHDQAVTHIIWVVGDAQKVRMYIDGLKSQDLS